MREMAVTASTIILMVGDEASFSKTSVSIYHTTRAKHPRRQPTFHAHHKNLKPHQVHWRHILTIHFLTQHCNTVISPSFTYQLHAVFQPHLVLILSYPHTCQCVVLLSHLTTLWRMTTCTSTWILFYLFMWSRLIRSHNPAFGTAKKTSS